MMTQDQIKWLNENNASMSFEQKCAAYANAEIRKGYQYYIGTFGTRQGDDVTARGLKVYKVVSDVTASGFIPCYWCVDSRGHRELLPHTRFVAPFVGPIQQTETISKKRAKR